MPTGFCATIIRQRGTAVTEEVVAKQEELKGKILSASQAGNANIAAVRAGNAVGLIDNVEPAGEIVLRIITEAEEVLRTRPNAILRG